MGHLSKLPDQSLLRVFNFARAFSATTSTLHRMCEIYDYRYTYLCSKAATKNPLDANSLHTVEQRNLVAP